MNDQFNQAIDIVVPWIDKPDESEEEEEEDSNREEKEEGEEETNNAKRKMIQLCASTKTGRPLYLIRRRKYIEPIRKQLQVTNRLLLNTYNTHAYYSCRISEMNEKVSEHICRTSAYRLITKLDDSHPSYLKNTLMDIDYQITTKLNELFHDKMITYSQWQTMIINRPTSQFDTLYFLPNTRRVCCSNSSIHFFCSHSITLFVFDIFFLRKISRLIFHFIQ